MCLCVFLWDIRKQVGKKKREKKRKLEFCLIIKGICWKISIWKINLVEFVFFLLLLMQFAYQLTSSKRFYLSKLMRSKLKWKFMIKKTANKNKLKLLQTNEKWCILNESGNERKMKLETKEKTENADVWKLKLSM